MKALCAQFGLQFYSIYHHQHLLWHLQRVLPVQVFGKKIEPTMLGINVKVTLLYLAMGINGRFHPFPSEATLV